MMRRLYSLVMWAAQPLLRRKLRSRGKAEPGYLEAVEERFGRYEYPAVPGAVWIHAVSLGETRAAAILIQALRERRPSLRILLTHGTATGRAEGAKLLREGDRQAWLPWDTPRAVEGFLNHFKPGIGVLMETEVWPNLAAACRARAVPLVLANARLSERSLRQALRLGSLSRAAYGSLVAVWAQTAADARRLGEVGAPVQRVFGNLKFDAAPDPALLDQGRQWRQVLDRPVIMFASSREGEEAEFFKLLAARREADPASVALIQWMVVPRHPQRFDEVAQLAAQHGLKALRRSQWTASGPQPADLWLGDSLGEMAMYYGLSDVALLGGSFAPLGGQNLIEASACGCPVVMGPHTFNFDEVAQLAEQAGAATRVDSMAQALQMALSLAVNTSRHGKAATAAATFAAAHRGAARKTADAVLTRLKR